jgi:hypothetical protein
VLGYSLVQSEEANKIIVEGVCDRGATTPWVGGSLEQLQLLLADQSFYLNKLNDQASQRWKR